MRYARVLHTASLLNNGTVLVAGGEGPEDEYLNSTELFEPTTESWTMGNNMHERRAHHTASVLTGGEVLIVGGYYHYEKPVRTAEIYDSSTGLWSNTSSMHYARATHTAVVLSSGAVLVVSGSEAGGAANMIPELFIPSQDMSTGILWSTV